MPKELLLDPQQMNSYSYARNSPISQKDPSGLSVYAVSKAIEGNALGTYIFLYLAPDDKSAFATKHGDSWTVGAYRGLSGNLEKAINAKSDLIAVLTGYSVPQSKLGAVKSKVLMPAPAGKTDTEFIAAIDDAYAAYRDDVKYDAFMADGYNSNSFATTMLINSGVQDLPWGGNAPGVDPGYGTLLPSACWSFDGKVSNPGLSAVSRYSATESGRTFTRGIINTLNSVNSLMGLTTNFISNSL